MTKNTHRRRFHALCLATLLGAVDASADPDPLPTFLPPRAGSVSTATREDRVTKAKKSRSVRDVEPALRPTLATLFNVHTLEAVPVGIEPTRDESALVSRFLRDRTTWEEHAIDPTCLRVVREMATLFQATRVEFISGYRSDKLNEHLRKKGHHVAQRSQHVLGHAVDFRLVGVPVQTVLVHLRRTHNGGVGFYPQSGFIHVDAGPRRRWAGQ